MLFAGAYTFIFTRDGRLLGPDGFPRLLKDYKTFKVTGKGREVDTLKRITIAIQNLNVSLCAAG